MNWGKEKYWQGLKCCEKPWSQILSVPWHRPKSFSALAGHIPCGLIDYFDECSHCSLSVRPPRAHARSTTPGSGGHPVHTGDDTLGASGLQCDPLPQLQPDGAVPLQGGWQGGEPGGGVLRHSESWPSAHHPQLDSVYQPECQAGSTQSRGSHGEQRARGSDWRGR